MRICEHACDRCRGAGLKGGLFYVLYLCNQRDMLMLFFSFSVSRGSEAWLGGERGQREDRYRLAPFGSLANQIFFSHLTGVEWTGRLGSLLSHCIPRLI
jgi:hypothetical protein